MSGAQPTFSAAVRAKALREELVKIMPGYDWTVHKTRSTTHLEATGTQSSGFNRMSTLSVTKIERDGDIAFFEVKSAGFGLRALFGPVMVGRTLARALRQLQDYYTAKEATYRSLAASLQEGRAQKVDPAKATGQQGGGNA